MIHQVILADLSSLIVTDTTSTTLTSCRPVCSHSFACLLCGLVRRTFSTISFRPALARSEVLSAGSFCGEFGFVQFLVVALSVGGGGTRGRESGRKERRREDVDGEGGGGSWLGEAEEGEHQRQRDVQV